MSVPGLIAVRTTCSEDVGFGHYRRCLTLAAEAPAAVVFIVTADERGAEVALGAEVLSGADPDATLAVIDRLGADALIVDDYAVTDAMLTALGARVSKLLVLSDHPRRIAADAVLDANPAAPQYDAPGALLLVGARYALLRREFRALPRRRAGDVNRVLVTLGGSNPGGRTGPIAEKLLAALPEVAIEVVAGPLFRGELPDDERLVVHRSPPDMVELMLCADLAIAAGGQTTYELAACGVPTLALCLAENQRDNLTALANIPTLRITSDDELVADVRALAADREARQQLADTGRSVFDGRGAERVWQELWPRWC